MLTLAQLADNLGGVWHGNAHHAINGFASLNNATVSDVAYFDNPSLQFLLESTQAGVVIIKKEFASLCPTNSVIVHNPLEAMIKASNYFNTTKSQCHGIDKTAVIHPSVRLGEGVSIGAHCFVGENVILSDKVVIGANTVINANVVIGMNSFLGSGVIVHSGCKLASQVVINSGAVIGSLPFNYLKEHGVWQQGPAVGSVVIADGVQIGANTVIDKGSLSDTYIAAGVCIDNLVQVGHDAIIGSHSAIAGCAAIGAFAQVGSHCVIGGASCIAAYVQLVDDVVITGMSTVSKSITKPGIYSSGTMVSQHQLWRKNAARFRRLDDYITKLNNLEQKLNNIDL